MWQETINSTTNTSLNNPISKWVMVGKKASPLSLSYIPSLALSLGGTKYRSLVCCFDVALSTGFGEMSGAYSSWKNTVSLSLVLETIGVLTKCPEA